MQREGWQKTMGFLFQPSLYFFAVAFFAAAGAPAGCAPLSVVVFGFPCV
jgi:hypothetical protein